MGISLRQVVGLFRDPSPSRRIIQNNQVIRFSIGKQSAMFAMDQRDRRTGVFKKIGNDVRGRERVDQHRDESGPHRAEYSRRIIRMVVQNQEYSITSLQSQ